MVDVNKLVKGDKIITSDGSGYLILGFEHINWIKVREIYSDGTQGVHETGLYIPLTNFEEFEKVYEWTDWRTHSCPDGEIAYYKTNRRDIKFKRDNIVVSCSCHEDDVFNLKYGLSLCYERWIKKNELNNNNKGTNKMNTVVTPKKVNVNKLENMKFGDYIAVNITGKDKSRHNIWMCVCPKCGDVIYATAYDLMHNRKNTTCKKCEDVRIEKETTSTSATTTSGYIDVQIGDPYPCDSTGATAIATTSTIWYNNGSVTTTYNEYDNTTTTPTAYADDDFNMPYAISEEVSNINYREIRKDLLSYPVYYNIVHCIPADLTFHGKTAKRINELYNLEHLFNQGHCKDFCNVGEVLWESNVFTMLPNIAKFTKVQRADLRECLYNLAMFCGNNKIKYLVMPRICSGGNKLPWHEVKDMILETFETVYTDNKFNSEIYMDFCYF